MSLKAWSNKAKAWTAIVAALMVTGGLITAIITGHDVIQFDAEANTWRDDHALDADEWRDEHSEDADEWREIHTISQNEKFKNDRVDRLERENARYERDLLVGGMPTNEREWIKTQIDKNNAKIKCIREDKC